MKRLPSPHRVFIGGSGGYLNAILDTCNLRLAPRGIIVLALATLEHLSAALDWFHYHHWTYRLLQVQLSRSVPIGELTRYTPLNPVTLVTAIRPIEE